ncbi:patatin-like phospholipase family protein [Rhizobiaceae bacterium BDR2-2]|uniref:Patatin-like phospholipase family protein n=1 Tax=Ectorhizobium quercum TaxID=2965071 RepID=A0AAE3SVS7_9HYPH|nr:patatin-like phospholipase family protein [Ectorhizobium quercum]MCX8996301.1 patatin-like phospholipase family protein [Ectorhizobium quercum]MCX8998660.1 patatin-like phospholipase family protein [Ectorhizobium quercum]
MTNQNLPAVVSSSTPTIAVAFGGGGARGLAHIHVIEVLDELGLKPVAVAGASIGAIMGAGLAAGMSGREIRDYAVETLGNSGLVFSRLWSIRPDNMRDALGGFRLGQFNLERILKAFLPEAIPDDFKDLVLPLKIVATDYYGQCGTLIETGPLRPAIAASAALPALFMPVRIHGRVLIDGGIFNPIPYEPLMDEADIVIGVDVVGAPEGDGTHVPNRIDSLFGASQLMMQANVALKLRIAPPHIFLRPPVNRFKVLDFLKVEEVLEATASVRDELKRELDRVIEARIRA